MDRYVAQAYTVGKCAPTHKGFYENRVWTMVELYGFSSNYAMQMSENTGRTRYLRATLPAAARLSPRALVAEKRILVARRSLAPHQNICTICD